jgi:glycosyltransferase involved in cell wall biosynthesis
MLTFRKARRYEQRLFSRFSLCLVTSTRDQREVEALLGRRNGVAVVRNGVDLAGGAPVRAPHMEKTLIYPGPIAYSANLDAVQYFIDEILPVLSSRIPDVRLIVTGSTDGVRLDRLTNAHVEFTGQLDDVRSLVAGSASCVVPLRIGGGTRLKILEAMALGTPVVSTSKGAEGLDVVDEEHLLIADSASAFADQIVRVLSDPPLAMRLTRNARALVEARYGWEAIGAELCRLIEALPVQPA